MHIFREMREKRRQKMRIKRALSAYAKNGWECPWIRKNSLWQALWK